MERKCVKIFYVYLLIDPRNNEVFYVGKGKFDRMFRHERDVKTGKIPNRNNKKLFNKIQSILDSGQNVKHEKRFENLEESDAFKFEIEEEARLRATGIDLCNLAPCGCGGDIMSNHPNKVEIYKRIGFKRPKKLTDEWKSNISKGLTGNKHSYESRKLRSEKSLGSLNPMFGKPVSQETRDKLSVACRGKIVSESTREKLRILQLGRTRTKETREKMRLAKRGTKLSLETKKRMSESHTGLVKSESTRKKLSESLKGRKFSDIHCQRISEFSKTRTKNKNPNFKPLSEESEKFILSNLDKSVNWIFNNLPEKASYGRIKRRIDDLKNTTAEQFLKK